MDPITLGLAGATLLGGLFGGNDGPEPIPGSETKQGFAALPPEVQQAYLQTYLPGILNLYKNGNQLNPMGTALSSPFESQNLPAIEAMFGNQRQMQGQQLQQQQAQMQALQQQLQQMQAAPAQNRPRGPQSLSELNRLGMGFNVNTGLVNGNGGVLFNRKASSKKGRASQEQQQLQQQIAQLQQQINQGQNALGAIPTGARPLSVEPLNEIQQNALMGFANQEPNDPYTMQALGQLSNLVANPFGNQGQLQNTIKSFMNPYQEQVIDRTIQRMQEQVNGGTNSIFANTARLGGLGAFGSSALGTRLANMENEAAQRLQDYIAQSNAENYNQAARLGIGTHYADLANQGQNLERLLAGGGAMREQQRMTLQDMLGAGNQIQQHGQNQINATLGQFAQNYPQNRLSQLGSNLNAIPASSIGSPQFTQGQPDMMAKIGGLGLTGLGLYNQYQQGLPAFTATSIPQSQLAGYQQARQNGVGSFAEYQRGLGFRR